MQMPDKLKVAYSYDESETSGICMRKNLADRAMVEAAFEALQASGEMKALLAK
jgi:polar amino acid transport system substrate-binding protein